MYSGGIQLGLLSLAAPSWVLGRGTQESQGWEEAAVWAGQVGSANLEMPEPLAIGTGAPAHRSRARLAGRETS